MKKDVLQDTSRRLFELFILLFALISLIIGMLSIRNIDNIQSDDSTENTTEYQIQKTNTVYKKLEVNYIPEPEEIVENQKVVEMNIDEAQLLMKLARSEAGDNGVEAQLLVMNVVMNRVNDENFPDSIKEVIYAKNQFSVVSNGSMKKTEPSADSHLALAKLESGEDISKGALFFESSSNTNGSWHKTREFLFEKYGQRFYR